MSATVTQYGFFYDAGRCTACHSCTVACKSWNMLDPGPVKLARVYEWESGAFPAVQLNTLFVPCYHCQNPVCIPAANGAIYKEPTYGAVLIDPAKANDPSLRTAWEACPYGSIVFDSDAPDANAFKCTMCIDRLQNNLLPACVQACPMRALDFGKLGDLQTKYGKSSALPGLPDSSAVQPSLVTRPATAPGQFVSYDATKALSILGKRGTLPPLYSNSSQVTTIPTGAVGRNGAPVLKAKGTAQLMQTTIHDEG